MTHLRLLGSTPRHWECLLWCLSDVQAPELACAGLPLSVFQMTQFRVKSRAACPAYLRSPLQVSHVELPVLWMPAYRTRRSVSLLRETRSAVSGRSAEHL